MQSGTLLDSSANVKGSGSKKTMYTVNVGAVSIGQMATAGGHSTLNETAALLGRAATLQTQPRRGG